MPTSDIIIDLVPVRTSLVDYKGYKNFTARMSSSPSNKRRLIINQLKTKTKFYHYFYFHVHWTRNYCNTLPSCSGENMFVCFVYVNTCSIMVVKHTETLLYCLSMQYYGINDISYLKNYIKY